MTEEEVEFLLSGGFDNAPKEQLEALLFTQHYAETKGNPDPETKQKLRDTYGEEKRTDIISHILIIIEPTPMLSLVTVIGIIVLMIADYFPTVNFIYDMRTVPKKAIALKEKFHFIYFLNIF